MNTLDIAADPTSEVADETTETQETPSEFAGRWLATIAQAEKNKGTFEKRGDRIIKRYRQLSENDDAAASANKFNLFWSNVQTLIPATYSRRPKAEVYRRFSDSDPVARLGGLILERALQYEIDCGLNFHETIKSTVLDRLLPGIGVAWVRYEPKFQTEKQEIPDPNNALGVTSQDVETLKDEKTPIDYVFWKDFLMSPARTWADVRWVARRLMFSKDVLRSRFEKTAKKFGGDILTVPCEFDPSQTDDETSGKATSVDTDTSLKRALVWELWDKESGQVLWVMKGISFPLDVVDDVTKLEEFFPCPKPLFATTTTDQLTPIADYTFYRSQLDELDTFTHRIALLVKALRVVGVYDSSQTSLQNLLTSGVENRMIPVDAWAAFAEKGGLKGVTDFLPLDMVVKVLEGLYVARDRTKQMVYEITGMADIIRGTSSASETLGAQQIKAKFANLRLSSRQQEVSEFVTRILQIKAEFVCKNYSPETLVRISSADQIEEVKTNPGRLEAALAFLKDGSVYQYRVSVQADSMVELDEVDERGRRNDFMSTLANFFLAMKNIASVAPEMMTVSLEMLKFVVRGFPVGRTLEYAIEDAATKIAQRMAQPKKEGPSPEELKLIVAEMQEKAETMRLRIKEDGATDREELKTSLALTLQGMADQIEKLTMSYASLDAMTSQPTEQPQPGVGP